MNPTTAQVLQFSLPFEGVQDRIRDAALAGKVGITGEARRAMLRDDITDVLVHRALRRGELVGRVRHTAAEGEWECAVSFRVKGFRSGGRLSVVISKGRIFVTDIGWDPKP